jgi:hypothetical protein
MPAVVPECHIAGVTGLDAAAAAEPRWLVPRGLIVVLAVTGLLVSVLAMREFASILGPVLLALILAMGVHPLTGILRRRGAPMWLAVTITLVTLTDHPAQGMSGAASREPCPESGAGRCPPSAYIARTRDCSAASVSGRQRVGAAVALLAAVLTIAIAVVEAISDFPEGLGILGLVAIALGAAWFGYPSRHATRRGDRRGRAGPRRRRGASDPQRQLGYRQPQDLAHLQTDYRRPLSTFGQTISTVVGLHFYVLGE